MHSSPWAWCDVVGSWSWPDHIGSPVVIEVYADADEVEVLLSGRSLGTAPVGRGARYRAEFETEYEPGELVAVARRDGEEIGRASLVSATGPVEVAVDVDLTTIRAHAFDLAYVAITLVDASGSLYNTLDRAVTVTIDGPGMLQGLGSANPVTEERFTDTTCTTFDGRALAVIRPTGAGTITVTVEADGCEPRSVAIEAWPGP